MKVLLAFLVIGAAATANAEIFQLDSADATVKSGTRIILDVDTSENLVMLKDATLEPARYMSVRSSKSRIVFPPTRPFDSPTAKNLGVGIYAELLGPTRKVPTGWLNAKFNEEAGRYEWPIPDVLPETLMARFVGYTYESNTTYQTYGSIVEEFDLGEVEVTLVDDPYVSVAIEGNVKGWGKWMVGGPTAAYALNSPIVFRHSFLEGSSTAVSFRGPLLYSSISYVWKTLPEPTSVVLAVLAFVGLLAGRRRR